MIDFQAFGALTCNCEEKRQRGCRTARSYRFRDRMPASSTRNPIWEVHAMTIQKENIRKTLVVTVVWAVLALGWIPVAAQQAVPRDPAEPAQGKPQPKIVARPAGRVARASVDEKSMRALIGKLVACGTRLTLSSWTDAKRGIGCGRDAVVARFNEIAKDSGGKLQVVVDKFESTSERTSGKPMPLENVYAILPGSDPKLAKTIFIVSGHFDSRPSNVMDPEADAPGADDDASGVAVGGAGGAVRGKAGGEGGGGGCGTGLFSGGLGGGGGGGGSGGHSGSVWERG